MCSRVFGLCFTKAGLRHAFKFERRVVGIMRDHAGFRLWVLGLRAWNLGVLGSGLGFSGIGIGLVDEGKGSAMNGLGLQELLSGQFQFEVLLQDNRPPILQITCVAVKSLTRATL